MMTAWQMVFVVILHFSSGPTVYFRGLDKPWNKKEENVTAKPFAIECIRQKRVYK